MRACPGTSQSMMHHEWFNNAKASRSQTQWAYRVRRCKRGSTPLRPEQLPACAWLVPSAAPAAPARPPTAPTTIRTAPAAATGELPSRYLSTSTARHAQPPAILPDLSHGHVLFLSLCSSPPPPSSSPPPPSSRPRLTCDGPPSRPALPASTWHRSSPLPPQPSPPPSPPGSKPGRHARQGDRPATCLPTWSD